MNDSPTSLPSVDRSLAKLKRVAIPAVKYALLALVLGCVVWAMHKEFSKTTRADLERLHPNWLLVLASALCFVGVNGVQMIRYRSLLGAYGTRPTWTQMAAIAWIPPLGKYVPGSIWAVGFAVAMLNRIGTSVAVAVSVVIMVDAFSELTGLLIAAPLLMRPPISDAFPAGRWLAPIFLVVGIAVMAPPVFNRLLALVLRVMKREPLGHLPTWGEYVVPLLTALAQWLFAGLSLWLMIRSVAPIALGTFPQVTMIAACALAVGYLFFLAPAGLGAREWIFLTMLPPMLADAPAGTVAIVTIAMRLMQVVVEVSLAGVGGLMQRFGDRPARAEMTNVEVRMTNE